jgi:hypothetical protein
MNNTFAYSIHDYYKNAQDNGYDNCTEKRFSILNEYAFNSVLDVGSGPCFLKTWLENKGVTASYEAVDIRVESLAKCDCPHYQSIPTNKKYDLVCLFGTVTYNIGGDTNHNKELLKSLLQQSNAICNSTLLFTVFKDSVGERYKSRRIKDYFIYFSKEEITSLLISIGITKFEIIENLELDRNEFFVICKIT